jgi:hypothetical protein
MTDFNTAMSDLAQTTDVPQYGTATVWFEHADPDTSAIDFWHVDFTGGGTGSGIPSSVMTREEILPSVDSLLTDLEIVRFSPWIVNVFETDPTGRGTARALVAFPLAPAS